MTGASVITAVGESLLATLRAQGAMSPGELAKAHGYKSTTALRHHMTPLLTAGRVVETGKAAALRFSLPVAHEPAPIRLTSPPIRLLGARVSRVTCPHCGSEDVERVGHQWVCACCAKAWAAFTRADEHLLRLFGIAAN